MLSAVRNIGSFPKGVIFTLCAAIFWGSMAVAAQAVMANGVVNAAALVIVTSIEQYAIKGYEVSAADFILKPLKYPLFASKLQRVIFRLAADAQSVSVAVRQKENAAFIPARNIYYIEVSGHDVVYHTIEGNIEAYGSLSKVEKSLSGTGFARCSAWCLVNLKHVEGLYGEEIKLYNGETLRISRTKRKAFMQALSDYYAVQGS